MNGFSDHLYTHDSELQVLTVLSLISTVHKSPQYSLSLSVAYCVFSRFLATASNSGDFFIFTCWGTFYSLPYRTLNWQLTWSPQLSPRHGPHRKRCYFRMLTASAGMCSRHAETGCVTPSIMNPLPLQRVYKLQCVGTEVLTAVVMYTSVFWDIKPCGPLKVTSIFRVGW
jgi:hypothetical protein